MRDCRAIVRIWCTAEDCNREITGDTSAYTKRHAIIPPDKLPMCMECGERLIARLIRPALNTRDDDE